LFGVVLVVKMKKLSASIYKPFWGWVERRIGLKIEREREEVYMQKSSF
jgi:hypothetical protein